MAEIVIITRDVRASKPNFWRKMKVKRKLNRQPISRYISENVHNRDIVTTVD